MGKMGKTLWTIAVIIGIVWAINKYGFTDDRGQMNLDHRAMSKDWNETCDKAGSAVEDWAWSFGKKFGMFKDSD